MAVLAALGLLGLTSSVSDASTAYVGTTSSGLYAVNLETGQPLALPALSPTNAKRIEVTADDRTAYVLHGGTTGVVTPIDVATNILGTPIASPHLAQPATARLAPDGRTLYVAAGPRVVPVDISGATPVVGTPITLTGNVSALAFAPDGRLFVAVNQRDVAELDLATGTLKPGLRITDGTIELLVGPDGTTLYAGTINGSRSVVQVIDLATMTEKPSIPLQAGTQTGTMTISGDSRDLLVTHDTNVHDSYLSRIDLATHAVTEKIRLGTAPQGARAAALGPRGSRLYVAGLLTRRFFPVGVAGGSLFVPPDAEFTQLPGSTSNSPITMGVAETEPAPADLADPAITAPYDLEAVEGFSGVVGDPTNPTLPISLKQAFVAGGEVPANELRITNVQSDTPSVIASDKITVTGNGSDRRVAFEPVGDGRARITLTVTGLAGKTGTFSFDYWVTKPTTPTSRVLQSTSDLSTAQDVGDGHLLVADDEKNDIRLYDSKVSGLPVSTFQVGPVQSGVENEVDFESSARAGDTIYWLGSQLDEDNRYDVYKTRLVGRGAAARVVPVGTPYQDLMPDLQRWDAAHGSPLGMSAASPALNTEGAEFAPGSTSTLYLGVRDQRSGTSAIVVPVTNFDKLHDGDGEHAEFDEPILLNLAGGTIREIRKNKNDQYLIVSQGDFVNESSYGLWSWSGVRGDAPMYVRPLPESTEKWADNADGWEAIGSMPDLLLPGTKVQAGLDQGEARLYTPYNSSTIKNKRLQGRPFKQKARVDWFDVTNPNVGAVAQATTPTFAAQATGTTGVGQWITVSNPGAQLLNVSDVRYKGDDEASEGEFLVSADECEDETIRPGGSCRVQVRFAPAREGATTAGKLVIEANVAGGQTLVPLTGTSTTLPAGPPGDDGAPGTPGIGTPGDKGAAGANGADGANGKDGSNGGSGPLGPIGPQGPIGPKGDAGAAGRDGTFSFAATRSKVSVRRGQTARVSFRIGNRTATTLRSASAKTKAPKALRVSGRTSLEIAALKAGQARTITVRLKIGRSAQVASHAVRVSLKIGSQTVTRTVTVQVRR
ncbi:MAG TPA: hypothetical protein VLK58_14135 [Conexibacter sp.]|nr:hypothetical protein [Conexibacter sp.]